jgi:hypothetical protein
LGSGGEVLSFKYPFFRPKNRSGTSTRRHGIPEFRGFRGAQLQMAQGASGRHKYLHTIR